MVVMFTGITTGSVVVDKKNRYPTGFKSNTWIDMNDSTVWESLTPSENLSEQEWEESEKRMDIIGQNGNDGLHYGEPTVEQIRNAEHRAILDNMKTKSDGSTASYYELIEGATELQHLISHKNMNAQIGEIFRACYRYGEVEHSEMMRDAKKIKFYAEAEIERLEKLNER
ncbi:hypothetical protein THIOSC15_1400004 [uncultured Thiomicrorhabdus sp.]